MTRYCEMYMTIILQILMGKQFAIPSDSYCNLDNEIHTLIRSVHYTIYFKSLRLLPTGKATLAKQPHIINNLI